MDFYQKIDYILAEANMSRRKLAEDAGIPPTTLQSAFSRKSKNPNMDLATNIIDALHLPISFLFNQEPFNNFEVLVQYRDEISKKLVDKGLVGVEDEELQNVNIFDLLDSIDNHVEKITVENGIVNIEEKEPLMYSLEYRRQLSDIANAMIKSDNFQALIDNFRRYLIARQNYTNEAQVNYVLSLYGEKISEFSPEEIFILRERQVLIQFEKLLKEFEYPLPEDKED